MAGGFMARGGWMVEAINLDGRDCYRVSRRGYYVGRGYCYSIAELEQVLNAHGLGLADFEENDPECASSLTSSSRGR